MQPPPQTGSRTGGGFRRWSALGAGGLKDCLVRRVLPRPTLHDTEQAPAFRLLRLLSREAIRVGGGIVHKLREKNGPARGERTTGPPEMHRSGVTFACTFLARRRTIDGFERERNLYELLLVVRHRLFSHAKRLVGKWPKWPRSTFRSGNLVLARRARGSLRGEPS